MAFVSEAERKPGITVVQSASGGLGPGEYHNEGYLHKRAMQTIYPKKAVPFNAVSNRGLVRDTSGGGTNSSPGKLLVLSFKFYFCFQGLDNTRCLQISI
tara:strand:- start:1118 stop:1414 length:297 start_codon:yes stop_codon:yes gene_type:complete